MKNIVLFFIFDDSVAYKYENLGLEIVSQCLNKAGYNSKLIYKHISDYKNFTQSDIDDFVKEIIDYNPSFVGSPVYPPSIKLIDTISET